MSEKPNPGNDEAIKQGCRCPVLDNCYGEGAYGCPVPALGDKPIFWINENCPIHGGSYERP